MLFNSYPFLFVFLPLSLLGYQLLGRFGRPALLGWLALTSLAFYGYWNPAYLALLLGSMAMNWGFSQRIGTGVEERTQRLWLTAAIVVNLLLLGYYKYLFPLLNFLHVQGGVGRGFAAVVLPLGISFWTFTQIAYLIDLRQGIAKRQTLLPYSVFVTFFPHLIAGPIIRPREIMPQLESRRTAGLHLRDVGEGLTWFVLGLSKKVLLADRIAPMADALFAHPHRAGLGASWLGAVAYAVELYFDFSGYSDMALGLARMFSIEFPVNFNSPFRSQSTIEFWYRWHMTLSRYLNEYLYTPIVQGVLGWRMDRGLRTTRKVTATPAGFIQMLAYPTMATMLIAGVWHGAGLQFVVFGVMQGAFLTVNHLWRVLTPKGSRLHAAVPGAVMTALTLVTWLTSLMFFRASGVHDAAYVLASMAGLHGMSLSLHALGAAVTPLALAALLLAGVLGFVAPSVWEIKPRPSVKYACGLGCLLVLAVLSLERESPFLYFQF